MTLTAHRIETVVPPDGTLTLNGLPFRAGQPVEVIVLPKPAEAPTYPLRGLPVRYDRPTEPVDADEWDAAK